MDINKGVIMAKNGPEVVKHIKTSGLELIYTLFLALLIALFFGLGVSAFYAAPKSLDYPAVLSTPATSTNISDNIDRINAQAAYDQAQKDYTTKSSTYNRNVSVITLGLAVLALVLSLSFLGSIYVISNGLLLGGVFTLMYSIVRGFMTADTKYRFLIVSVGLLITLALGYIKFIKPQKEYE
jgi:hypothetical protein